MTTGGASMLCGYNTNGLQNHRLADALRLLSDEGFEAVALTLDVQHLDPFVVTASDVATVARLLAQLGLVPVIETGARFLLDPRHKHEPTLMTRDRAARARRIDFYARAAAIGRDLGASVLSFWVGIDRAPAADAREWMDAGIAATVEVVRSAGLQPALEPEPGMAIATMADYAAMRRRLGAVAPELTLDIGHLYVDESAPAASHIEAHARAIRQVHLEDMRRGVHEHLLPGDGDVDFAADLGALSAAGYRGPVCFELSRSSHMAVDALRRCRELWLRIVHSS